MLSLAMPAEGVTLEYLTRIFAQVLLQPLLTGGLLLASLKRPDDVQKVLFKIFKTPGVDLVRFKRVLKYLLVIGLLRKLNNTLSVLALNNWTTDRSWDWRHEIVLVTGGCSGIGEAVVHALAKKGIRVVIFDVAEPRSPLPPGVKLYKVDVSSSEAIHEAAERVRNEVGNPSVIVNNAAAVSRSTILEETEEKTRKVFEVNVLAHYHMVREFVPYMTMHNHGHIVTVASLASFLSRASGVTYCSSKAAILAFHEGLAQELKSKYNARKVRTTIVHPYWVRTPLVENIVKSELQDVFVLEPSTVANAIVNQLMKGESAQLILPGRFNIGTSVRGWPNWMQEIMRGSTSGQMKKK